MSIEKVLGELNKKLDEQGKRGVVPFAEFLEFTRERPELVFRNIFQLFSDLVDAYVSESGAEVQFWEEKIIRYDFKRLLIDGQDDPFFIDHLFGERLMGVAHSFRGGRQQNKIYLFEGPPGCGKSIFLNNLLQRMEEYTRTEDGSLFETVWKLDVKKLGGFKDECTKKGKEGNFGEVPDFLEVPCPNHDHPLLQVPKKYRQDFLNHLIVDETFKERLFNEKQYEWVLSNEACTVCVSLYEMMLERLSPAEALGMLTARRSRFNRKTGEGISIFNPSDPFPKEDIFTNKVLQEWLNDLWRDSERVKYLFSSYAKTNNGVYALMDVKQANVQRFKALHGLVSDNVHKVGVLEEFVDSLFLAVINPEDREAFKDMASFSDRIITVPCRYVLDYQMEMEIYKNKFGENIGEFFVPEVLENFARIVISSRLVSDSTALKEWISDAGKYQGYCDDALLMLKMEVYSDRLPRWLSEEDRKTFTPERRRAIMAEAVNEGDFGISGRRAIEMFSDFFLKYADPKKPITMRQVVSYFKSVERSIQIDLDLKIDTEFIKELVRVYDQQILRQIKESLCNYDDEQIINDVKNYLWAMPYDQGAEVICGYTGDKIKINEDFFDRIEHRMMGGNGDRGARLRFRKHVSQEYNGAISRSIQVLEKNLTETEVFRTLYSTYVFNVREHVLRPFLGNDNFGHAIKDYFTPLFNTYDLSLRKDVKFLMDNLQSKFGYTAEAAQQICIYAIDDGLLNQSKVKPADKPNSSPRRDNRNK